MDVRTLDPNVRVCGPYGTIIIVFRCVLSLSKFVQFQTIPGYIA